MMKQNIYVYIPGFTYESKGPLQIDAIKLEVFTGERDDSGALQPLTGPNGESPIFLGFGGKNKYEGNIVYREKAKNQQKGVLSLLADDSTDFQAGIQFPQYVKNNKYRCSIGRFYDFVTSHESGPQEHVLTFTNEAIENDFSNMNKDIHDGIFIIEISDLNTTLHLHFTFYSQYHKEDKNETTGNTGSILAYDTNKEPYSNILEDYLIVGHHTISYNPATSGVDDISFHIEGDSFLQYYDLDLWGTSERMWEIPVTANIAVFKEKPSSGSIGELMEYDVDSDPNSPDFRMHKTMNNIPSILNTLDEEEWYSKFYTNIQGLSSIVCDKNATREVTENVFYKGFTTGDYQNDDNDVYCTTVKVKTSEISKTFSVSPVSLLNAEYLYTTLPQVIIHNYLKGESVVANIGLTSLRRNRIDNDGCRVIAGCHTGAVLAADTFYPLVVDCAGFFAWNNYNNRFGANNLTDLGLDEYGGHLGFTSVKKAKFVIKSSGDIVEEDSICENGTREIPRGINWVDTQRPMNESLNADIQTSRYTTKIEDLQHTDLSKNLYTFLDSYKTAVKNYFTLNENSRGPLCSPTDGNTLVAFRTSSVYTSNKSFWWWQTYPYSSKYYGTGYNYFGTYNIDIHNQQCDNVHLEDCGILSGGQDINIVCKGENPNLSIEYSSEWEIPISVGISPKEIKTAKGLEVTERNNFGWALQQYGLTNTLLKTAIKKSAQKTIDALTKNSSYSLNGYNYDENREIKMAFAPYFGIEQKMAILYDKSKANISVNNKADYKIFPLIVSDHRLGYSSDGDVRNVNVLWENNLLSEEQSLLGNKSPQELHETTSFCTDTRFAEGSFEKTLSVSISESGLYVINAPVVNNKYDLKFENSGSSNCEVMPLYETISLDEVKFQYGGKVAFYINLNGNTPAELKIKLSNTGNNKFGPIGIYKVNLKASDTTTMLLSNYIEGLQEKFKFYGVAYFIPTADTDYQKNIYERIIFPSAFCAKEEVTCFDKNEAFIENGSTKCYTKDDDEHSPSYTKAVKREYNYYYLPEQACYSVDGFYKVPRKGLRIEDSEDSIELINTGIKDIKTLLSKLKSLYVRTSS